MKTSLLIFLLFAPLMAFAKPTTSHCYHWYNDMSGDKTKYIYTYASAHDGELSFADKPNGPEDGLYCTETLEGSAIYGDHVIRIEFTDDVVFSDGARKLCGKTGDYYPAGQCQAHETDVKFYKPEAGWFFILGKRKAAIKSWTANSADLVTELKGIVTQDAELRARLDLTIANIAGDGTHKSSTVAFSRARAGVDDLIRNEKNWGNLGGPSQVLQRLAYSRTIGEPEKEKLAEKATADLMGAGELKLTSEFMQLLDSSKPVKAAVVSQLLANEASWPTLGTLSVLDVIYFSNLPNDQRSSIVNKIVVAQYKGLDGAQYKERLKVDMQKSQALQDIYSREIFSDEAGWDKAGCLNLLNQIAKNAHLTPVEQSTYGARIMMHMFGNVMADYDRQQLNNILATSQPLQKPFVAILQSRFLRPMNQSNVQLIVDGYVISHLDLAPSGASLIWGYALTNPRFKTPALKKSLGELRYTFQ